jgi:hypothetical protein
MHIDNDDEDNEILKMAELTRILAVELYKSANYYNGIFEKYAIPV